jgi:hypothetical protein
MTRAARFSQMDLERLFRAARKADVRVRARIKLNGEIEADVLTAAEGAANDSAPNSLERYLNG